MNQLRKNYITSIRETHSKQISDLCTRQFRYFLMGFCIFLFTFSSAVAQNGSIRDIDVFITESRLNMTCHFIQGFIDEDMRQTLSSGMSSTFNFQITIRYENGSNLRSQLDEIVIRYDIWEKQYLLFHHNQIHQFAGYPAFESFLADSLSFDLGPVKGIDAKKSFRVIVFFSPEKISSAQKERLNYWLANIADTEESAPGSEQESGFSIDLSKLFSVFLSKAPKAKVQQYKSGTFRIDTLRKNEKPAQ